MATRSLIGVYGGDDEWQCRYVHWDGYPEGVGVELCRIISRDGADEAVRRLIRLVYSWSSVCSVKDSTQPSAPNHFAVPDYGIAHHDGDEDYIGRSDDMDCEWAYLIVPHQGMMDVYHKTWDATEWSLYGAMDCASRRLLTVKGKLEVVA